LSDSEGTVIEGAPTAERTTETSAATNSTAARTVAPAAPLPTIGRRDAWVNFAYLGVWGYMLYGLGNATPYLKHDMGLTDFQAGLHGSVLAIGTLAVGLSLDTVARRFGSRWLLDIGVLALTTGVAMFVLAPALAVSLSGAVLLGVAGAMLGTQVNLNLTRSDSVTSRRLISQANAIAMATAFVAPVVMGLAVDWLGIWRIAMVIPVVAALALTALRTRPPREERSNVRLPRGHLPRAYWFVWLVIALSVGIEFSFVFWGSSIVSLKAGIAAGDATKLASLFVAGMFASRFLIGRGLGVRRNPRTVIATGLAVGMVGAGLIWVSHSPVLAAVGLFVGGAGTGGLYPIGLNLALEKGGAARYEAATRATLASGLAVMLAPSVLGLASDAVGVSNAWPIIMLMAVAAMVVLAVTPHPNG
jgi:MFS family permease